MPRSARLCSAVLRAARMPIATFGGAASTSLRPAKPRAAEAAGEDVLPGRRGPGAVCQDVAFWTSSVSTPWQSFGCRKVIREPSEPRRGLS